MKTVIIFICVQFLSIFISTCKYILVGNSNVIVDTSINAISVGISNLATIFLVAQNKLDATIISIICTFIAVPLARWIIYKLSKDQLFVFDSTIKCTEEEINNLKNTLKESGIHSVWQPVIQDKMYKIEIYSTSKQNSKIILNEFKKYNVHFHVNEARTI